MRQGQAHWRHLHDKVDDRGEVLDRFLIHESERASAEGYRVLWYHRRARPSVMRKPATVGWNGPGND